MRTVGLSTLTWRKSSYSNPDGGECVEVSDDLLATATWQKSSYSNPDGGQCIEPRSPTTGSSTGACSG